MSSLADETQVADLVLANHILFDQGVVDGFGHVSTRSVKNPQHFLLSRSMAPSLVAAKDIVTYDLDGEGLDAEGRTGYLERFIHSEIYRARPEIMAVVHSHSVSVLPFGVAETPMRPVFHMAGFLTKTSRFEIREDFGAGTDMLIRNPAMGRSLARSLGCNCVTLMRGHGSVAAGGTLQEAVYRAIYTEVNAKIQLQALAAMDGPLNYLTDEEGDASVETMRGQYGRSWALWATRVSGKQV